jgi:hypothetical protein
MVHRYVTLRAGSKCLPDPIRQEPGGEAEVTPKKKNHQDPTAGFLVKSWEQAERLFQNCPLSGGLSGFFERNLGLALKQMRFGQQLVSACRVSQPKYHAVGEAQKNQKGPPTADSFSTLIGLLPRSIF